MTFSSLEPCYGTLSWSTIKPNNAIKHNKVSIKTDRYSESTSKSSDYRPAKSTNKSDTRHHKDHLKSKAFTCYYHSTELSKQALCAEQNRPCENPFSWQIHHCSGKHMEEHAEESWLDLHCSAWIICSMCSHQLALPCLTRKCESQCHFIGPLQRQRAGQLLLLV